MEGKGKRPARKGCIKTTKAPWVVRREGRDGHITTSLRRPSDQEREKNRQRERRRRRVAARIYSCLRKYANYSLPKHSDQNDVLKALCQEAGWHVQEDGTIYRKRSIDNPPTGPRGNISALLTLQLWPPEESRIVRPPSTHMMTDIDLTLTNSQEEATKDACHAVELRLTLGLPTWFM